MKVQEIVQQLKDERGKLDAAIQTLDGVSNGASPKRRGRPAGSANRVTAQTFLGAPNKPRTMSAAAHRLISIAQKKRWAKQRRAA
jgi:hypothetical protein